MADIGQKAALKLNPEKREALEALITMGFVTPSDESDAEVAPYDCQGATFPFREGSGSQ